MQRTTRIPRLLPLVLLTPLLFAILRDSAAAEPLDFGAILARHSGLTYDQLFAGLPKRNDSEKLPFDPADAKHYDTVTKALRLSDDEEQLLLKNGFVVVHREPDISFPRAFIQLYRKDLPLIVTTDAVLHVVHRAHDDIVKEMEETSLSVTLKTVLSHCRQELAARVGKPHDAGWDDNYRDVDLYLTMALTLLDGKSAAPQFTQSDEISELLDMLDTLKMPGTMSGPFVELYGGRRLLDASQFKPRGHYTKSEMLKRYFRAMMWLGRADTGFNVLPVDAATKVTCDSRRELRDAVLITELLTSTAAIQRLEEMDKTVEFLVGQGDNLTPFDFAKLLEKEGIKSLADVATDDAADRLQKAIRQSGLGQQKICSQVMETPARPGQAPPPCVFQFFGQR